MVINIRESLEKLEDKKRIEGLNARKEELKNKQGRKRYLDNDIVIPNKSLKKRYLDESSREDSEYIQVPFNGKEYKAKIYCGYKSENLSSKIDDAIKAFNSPNLFNYIYNYQKDFFDEINNDPYYKNIKINSGSDIKKYITDIETVILNNNAIYISGRCDFEDEHGFSICFPNGKFVKSKYYKFNYNRDCGKSVNYIPQCTVLGHRTQI